MIIYDTGPIGIFFVLRISGSVLPKGLLWAFPSVFLTACIHKYFPYLPLLEGFEHIWGGYTFVLGFLITFRNNQAYNRFWEGATLLHQIQGEWLSAVSSIFAFCSTEEDDADKVYQYQHLVVRLMSMLHCQAIQLICDLDDDALEIIDVTGLSEDSLAFLSRQVDRCQVLMQWLQRSIVQADKAGTIKIAPPILSRAFQELSRGLVNLNNVRKIKKIPFPYPYAQILQVMLMAYWSVTPFLSAHLCHNIYVACSLSFCVSTAFWSLIYIANEIDNPFGDDANDFNLEEMQQDMNNCLLTLLQPNAQSPPAYVLHEKGMSLVRSDVALVGLKEAKELGTMSQVRHRLWSLPVGNGAKKRRESRRPDSVGDPCSSTTPGRMRMSQVIRSFGATAFPPQTVVVDAPKGDSFVPGQARTILPKKDVTSFAAVQHEMQVGERRSLDSCVSGRLESARQSRCSEEATDGPLVFGDCIDPSAGGKYSFDVLQHSVFGRGNRQISGNSDALSSVPLGRVEEDLEIDALEQGGNSEATSRVYSYTKAASREQLEEGKPDRGVSVESQAQSVDGALPEIDTSVAPSTPITTATPATSRTAAKDGSSRSSSPGERTKGNKSSVREGLESALASLTCRIEEKKRPSQPRVETLQVDSAPSFPQPQTRPSLLVGPVVGVNVNPRNTDRQLLLDLPNLDAKRAGQAASSSTNGGRLSPVPESAERVSSVSNTSLNEV